MPGLPSRMASLLIPSRRNVRKIFPPFAPTLGAELLTDGGMENWTDANNLTNWSKTIGGTSTLNRESSAVNAGTYAARLDCDGAGSSAQIFVGDIAPAFARVAVMARNSAGTSGITIRNSGTTAITVNLNQTYTEKFIAARFANSNVILGRLPTTAYSLYLDTASVKQINIASAFSATNSRMANFNLVAPPISQYDTGTNAGIVLCLDSVINPLNFIIAYLHPNYSTNIIVEKCVAGVYTALSTVAAAYGATKFFSAKKDGTSINIYYGTVAHTTLIANITVADAGITSNTRHGLFNTYSGNLFAATPFTVAPYS